MVQLKYLKLYQIKSKYVNKNGPKPMKKRFLDLKTFKNILCTASNLCHCKHFGLIIRSRNFPARFAKPPINRFKTHICLSKKTGTRSQIYIHLLTLFISSRFAT